MTAIDHGLAALLALLCLSQLLLRIDPARFGRMTLYRGGAATGLLLALLPLLAWQGLGRPLDSLGLAGWGRPSAPLLGAGLAWSASLALAVALATKGVGRARVAALYGRYAPLMPRSRAELLASWATSICAGVGEEIAFRGFLLGYSAALLGLGGGLLITSLLFGAAHAYQRAAGMAWATGAGLVLGCAVVASGSLVLAIWMHASWNMASFTIGRIVLAPQAGSGEARRASL